LIKLILNIALILGVFYLVRELFSASTPKSKNPKPTPKAGPDAELLVEDPQCGVYVPQSHAVKGPGDLWFCSAECLEAYRRSRG